MVYLTLANPDAIRYACMNYHYAERVPINAISFNVYQDGVWCGVIMYGYGANPYIAENYGKWQGQVLELVRVALNGKQNTTSECLAVSLKMLKKYAPMVDMVVSFADKDQDHEGIIYQATNWLYTGVSGEGANNIFVINGKEMHQRSIGAKGWKFNEKWLRENVDKNATQSRSKGKIKYIYPLNKKMRRQVKDLALPYPKSKE